jgi:threonine synthase
MEAVSNAFYASHCWNPFFLHGTKTFAYEVCEQLNWKSPDTIVLPVGHGTLFLGTYLGFKELKEAGIVGKIPKLIGIQSAACAPLEEAFKKGEREIQPLEKQETVAEGIAIAKPVRGSQVLEVIRETRGKILSVTEEEIVTALQEMGQKGYFIEPTSAATLAGLKKYGKHIKKEVIVTTLTGTGLKASERIGHLY